MIDVVIPGYKRLQLKHLVMDYNGTIACDGSLVAGVEELVNRLSRDLEVHVVTADTFGKAARALADLTTRVLILPIDNQDQRKREYVENLGSVFTVCIGNGKNDRLMLKTAELGIAVIGREGLAVEALLSADIVCDNILSALALLTNTGRLIATLRS